MLRLVERLMNWARAKRSRSFKALSALVGASFFLVALPLLMTLASARLDAALQLPPWPLLPLNLASGLMLMALGLSLACWSA